MVTWRCLAIPAACLPSLHLPFVPLHAEPEHSLLCTLQRGVKKGKQAADEVV